MSSGPKIHPSKRQGDDVILPWKKIAYDPLISGYRMAGDVNVEEPLRKAWYDLLRPFRAVENEDKNDKGEIPIIVNLVTKPAYDKIGSVGYLYENIHRELQDKFDHEFVTGVGVWKRMKFFALHAHGGYHGFFRPDLDEVISIIHDKLPPVETIACAFVTTTAHPDGNVTRYYDQHADRHRAKTTVYYKLKDTIDP